MKRWLVLVGGGARGRWQAGALAALHKAGLLLDLDGVVGTSVGGLNACALVAGMAQGDAIKLLREAWDAIKQDTDIYAPSLTALQASLWRHPFDAMGVAKGFLTGPAACSTDALEKMLNRVLGGWSTERLAKTGVSGIKEVPLPQLYVRAYNYQKKVAETLTGDLAAMALATSAIEGIFPQRWGYGDGGAVDNCPANVALAAGADQVLVVYCGPEIQKPFPRPLATVRSVKDSGGSTGLKDLMRLVDGLTDANEDLVDQAVSRAEAERGVQVVHCYPFQDTGSALDFTPRNLWERGQKEAAAAIADAQKLGW